MIAKFGVSRAGVAMVSVFLCSQTALPTVATAADRSLGADAAAACAALSGAGNGAIKIDTAALVEAKPLTVAEGGPTPAARINPATPKFCRVLGHIDPTDPKAPPIRFQLNLPLQWNGRSVQYGGGGFNGVLITGLGLPPAAPFDSRLAAGEGICHLRHQLRSRNQAGRTAAAVCRQRRGVRQLCACLLQEGARRRRDADRAGLWRQARQDLFRRQFGGRARGPDHGAALSRRF